jgi:hypothetical protein
MQNQKTGTIWIILGAIGFIVGILLTATLVGLICGLPIIIGSIPLLIYGAMQNHKWKMDKLTESIKEGLREGLNDKEIKNR